MKLPSRMQASARDWIKGAAVAIALIVTAYLIFEFGRIQAKYNIVDAASEQQALVDEIADLEERIVALKQEVAILETHRDIDREAYLAVEQNLGKLQKKIQEQRDAIAFYRGIVSPADGGRGLRVQDLKVMKGKGERQYHVRLVLVQVKQHDRNVRGEVDFSIEGAQDGADVTYTLKQLSPADAGKDWPFSFRYFQNFDRELILPAGFTPENINVEVISQTRSIASVKQSFLWATGQS